MNLIEFLKSFEGCRLNAYQDSAGIWTIGYGHTAAWVKKGLVIGQEYAEQLLTEDSAHAAAYVAALVDKPIGARYTAMVSLCFNIGRGSFLTSSVLKFHRARAFQAAANSFLMWDKAHVDGQLVVVKGLLNRRERERDFYLLEGL